MRENTESTLTLLMVKHVAFPHEEFADKNLVFPLKVFTSSLKGIKMKG